MFVTFLAVSLGVVATQPKAAPRVELTTPSGKLSGFVDASHGGARVFRGIRYAKPPLGDLRWRAPQPYGSWSGVRDASKFGNPCIQPIEGGWATIEGLHNSSEDCLYLNVVAPPMSTATSAAALPVIVYLHAGEFHYGSASDRESDWPFGSDMILVTPNSRLGAFGFLGADQLRSRTADNSTGNYGIADQTLALQWVQANIAAFGGNASNVLLMGESSGGTSVAAHLVSPASWGLFHKAILESPGLTQTKPMADAEVNFEYLTSALLAAKSSGCKRAPAAGGGGSNSTLKYAKFGKSYLSDGWGPGRRKPLATGTDWSYEKSASMCDANPACNGFSMVSRPKTWLRKAYVHVELHAIINLIGAGYLHLPANTSVTSYLKAAAGGDDATACLVQANASTISALTDFMPRGDTFQTDAWAPSVDGVAQDGDIIRRLNEGKVAPGVSILAGSNMDEGTIFMGLTPRMSCRTSSASSLQQWADAFYGTALGAQIPTLYSAPRMPLPQCGRYADEAQGDEAQDDVETATAPATAPATLRKLERRRRLRQVAARFEARLAAAATSAEAAAEEGAAVKAAPLEATEAASSSPPSPPPQAGLYYMAAMRSAGDYAITCRVRQMAAQMARRKHAVYTYYFTHTPRFSENYQDLPTLGAFHGAEVPFAFGDGFELKTQAEKDLSAAMGCYWRNFAHTGNPNAGPCAAPPRPWAAFAPGAQETTMVLDVGSGLGPEQGLRSEQCEAFAKAGGWPD